MKKTLICMILLTSLLVGCGGSNEKDEEGKNTESPSETPVVTTVPPEEDGSNSSTSGVVNTESEDTEKNIPFIPGDVIYTDDNNIWVEDPGGNIFHNGNEVNKEAYEAFKENIKENPTTTKNGFTTVPHDENGNKIPETTIKKTSSSTSKKPSETSTSKKPADTEETVLDFDLPEVIETERPTGTIYLEEEDQYLAKYVKSDNTELDISKVKVYSSSKPGVSGIESFEPGDSMYVNIWCNTEMKFDSTIYIVPRIAEHKDSYKKIECLVIHEMYNALEAGTGHLFTEISIPKNTPAGVYELRFVCGTEEGYIPFHIGYNK